MNRDTVQEERPLVSVITPCYNDGDWLLECVDAVAASSYENIEQIIVNDGSTDEKTLALLEELKSRSHVRIVTIANGGVVNARNRGIELATGSYILPVDADDRISPRLISLCVEQFIQNSRLRVVATSYQLFGEIRREVILESFSMEKLLGHNLFVVTTMFPKSEFIRVGGFKTSMNAGLEDWDFWLSILDHPDQVVYIEGIHFYYRIKRRQISRNASIDDEKHRKLRRQIWENHKELFARYFPDPRETFEYMNVAYSKEYRLGSVLLGWIRKLLNK